MKKFLAIILACVLAFSLAACGSGGTDDTVDDTDEAEDSAVVEEQEEITIIFANSNSESSTTGSALNAMLDYIEENTDGKITFSRYFGESICDAEEEYQYLVDGSIGMAAPKPADFADQNPYVYGVSLNTSWEDCYNYYQYIFFENEETATIIADRLDEDGLELLGALASGQGCVLSTKEFSSIDDLTSMTMGCVQSADVWESLGCNVVNTSPSEMYESLSKGVYDCAGFALSYYIVMSLDEVAPYVMNASEYQTSLTVLIRDDIWDQFTDETKQVFMDAAEYAYNISVEDSEAVEEEVEEAAEVYFTLDLETAQYMTAYMEKTNAELLCGYAEASDGEEGLNDMITICAAKEDYTGYDIVPDEYK